MQRQRRKQRLMIWMTTERSEKDVRHTCEGGEGEKIADAIVQW